MMVLKIDSSDWLMWPPSQSGQPKQIMDVKSTNLLCLPLAKPWTRFEEMKLSYQITIYGSWAWTEYDNRRRYAQRALLVGVVLGRETSWDASFSS